MSYKSIELSARVRNGGHTVSVGCNCNGIYFGLWCHCPAKANGDETMLLGIKVCDALYPRFPSKEQTARLHSTLFLGWKTVESVGKSLMVGSGDFVRTIDIFH
jgi:hypothetical protein